jgi:WD40 repeat protein
MVSLPCGRSVLSLGPAATNDVQLSTGHLLKVFDAHYRAITCLAWTPDSQVLLSGSEDSSIHGWATKSYALPVPLSIDLMAPAESWQYGTTRKAYQPALRSGITRCL